MPTKHFIHAFHFEVIFEYEVDIWTTKVEIEMKTKLPPKHRQNRCSASWQSKMPDGWNCPSYQITPRCSVSHTTRLTTTPFVASYDVQAFRLFSTHGTKPYTPSSVFLPFVFAHKRQKRLIYSLHQIKCRAPSVIRSESYITPLFSSIVPVAKKVMPFVPPEAQNACQGENKTDANYGLTP